MFSIAKFSAFKEFLILCGIPFQIVTDNHNSYVGKDSDFNAICRDKDILRLAIEPFSHWQNQAEAAIRELKRLFNKVLKSTGMPRKL
jgi:transposase